MANFNYEVTYRYAVEKLRQKDPFDMAAKSGASFDPEKQMFFLKYFLDEYQITYPDGVVAFKDKPGEVTIATRILLLHYLTDASGTPLQNRWISYKELPGGQIYISPFTKRAINPLVNIFGNQPDKLLQLAERLGGKKESIGDVSVTFPILPRIPLTFVLWLGDDEFPPSGNILFDASAPDYLHTEDYAVLASAIVWSLKKIL